MAYNSRWCWFSFKFFFFLAELIIIQIENSILHQDLQFEIKELRKMYLFYTSWKYITTFSFQPDKADYTCKLRKLQKPPPQQPPRLSQPSLDLALKLISQLQVRYSRFHPIL